MHQIEGKDLYAQINIEEKDLYAQINIDHKTKEVTIYFRGTKNIQNIYRDIYIDGAFYSFGPGRGRLHKGFYLAFQDLWPKIVKKLNSQNIPSNYTFNFAGHSLGGGIATIGALYFKNTYKDMHTRLITFGAPECLSYRAQRYFSNQNIETHRIAEESDLINYITPAITGINYHPTNEMLLIKKNATDPLHRMKGYVSGISSLENLNNKQTKTYKTYYAKNILLLASIFLFSYLYLELSIILSLTITASIFASYFIHYALYPIKALHQYIFKDSFDSTAPKINFIDNNEAKQAQQNNKLTLENLKKIANTQMSISSDNPDSPKLKEEMRNKEIKKFIGLSLISAITTSILTYFYFNTASIIATTIIGTTPSIITTYVITTSIGLLIPATIFICFLALTIINSFSLFIETKLTHMTYQTNNLSSTELATQHKRNPTEATEKQNQQNNRTTDSTQTPRQQTR
jgi:hypothetical protein